MPIHYQSITTSWHHNYNPKIILHCSHAISLQQQTTIISMVLDIPCTTWAVYKTVKPLMIIVLAIFYYLNLLLHISPTEPTRYRTIQPTKNLHQPYYTADFLYHPRPQTISSALITLSLNTNIFRISREVYKNITPLIIIALPIICYCIQSPLNLQDIEKSSYRAPTLIATTHLVSIFTKSSYRAPTITRSTAITSNYRALTIASDTPHNKRSHLAPLTHQALTSSASDTTSAHIKRLWQQQALISSASDTHPFPFIILHFSSPVYLASHVISLQYNL